jgi:hypothetical protein
VAGTANSGEELARAVAEAGACACSAAASAVGGNGREQARRRARGGSRRARGAWGPLDSQMPPSPTHGIHAAAGVCRGQGTGAREG